MLGPIPAFAGERSRTMSVLCFRCSTVLPLAAFLAALSASPVAAQPAGAVSELTELRTANAKQWLNADGTTTAEIFSGPIHYQDSDGTWKEIDTTLGPATKAGCAYSVVKNPVKVYLSDTSSDWQTMEAEGVSVSYMAETAAKSLGTADGSSIVYPEAWPSVDLKYTVVAEGVKEELTLKAQPSVTEFRFVLRPGALRPTTSKGGTVEFLDQSGVARLWIPAPVMYDAAGQTSHAIKMSFTQATDGTMTFSVVPDEKWLSKAKYPVTLDPLPIFCPSLDGFYEAWYWEEEGYAYWVPTAQFLYIGQQYGAVTWITCIKFFIYGIPTNSKVTNANTKIELATYPYGSTGVMIGMKRILGNWNDYWPPAMSETLFTQEWPNQQIQTFNSNPHW